MKILVTGGVGYIGQILCPLLQERGHKVWSIDNRMYGQRHMVFGGTWPVMQYVDGDARSVPLLGEILPQADAVIALAAIVGAPACDRLPLLAESTNYGAIDTLCSMMRPEQLLLYPNTNSGYGIGGEALCNEDSPLAPVSLYGRTKCEAEARVMERENSVALRLATVYGPSPRMRTDLMVNDFVHTAVHSPEVFRLYQPQARRNFVHIRDVAGAFIHALDNFDRMKGQVYNCGDTSANMTKAALCDKIATHVPGFTWVEIAGEDVDKRDYLVSNAKLEETGWQPQVSFDDGIKELVEYYDIHRERCGNA